MTVTVQLPWPPSVNHYWMASGHRRYISSKGRDFRAATNVACYKIRNQFPKDTKLSVLIDAYPPDRRKRDLDNILKSVLDSLQHAQVYKDDNQIDRLAVHRCVPLDGCIVVTISEC